MLIHPVNTCEVPERFQPNEINTSRQLRAAPTAPRPAEASWDGWVCAAPQGPSAQETPLPGSHQATVVSPRILVGLGGSNCTVDHPGSTIEAGLVQHVGMQQRLQRAR